MRHLAVVTAGVVLAAWLGSAMLELPPAPVHLSRMVSEHMAESGVEHPVTAVLLNFRGYDTLLEIAVLLLALVGLLAVAKHGNGARDMAPVDPVLELLARLVAPLMVVGAVYLLWAGAHRPGGAFQAGAVLAAAAVLLNLTRLLPAWTAPRALLRAGLAAGFLIFLAVAAALLFQGTLLQYPPALAGALILFIEAGLTVSLGLTLAGLFLFLSEDQAARE